MMRDSRRSEMSLRRPTAEVSLRMKSVRQRDTEPELSVRKVLQRLGARYRLCPHNLPGRPDIANAARRWCIFVHGCFWHGHNNCSLYTVPKTNTDWWKRKVEDNRARD